MGIASEADCGCHFSGMLPSLSGYGTGAHVTFAINRLSFAIRNETLNKDVALDRKLILGHFAESSGAGDTAKRVLKASTCLDGRRALPKGASIALRPQDRGR
jgi:hypothetical protein